MEPKDERKSSFSYFYDKLGFENNTVENESDCGCSPGAVEHVCDHCHHPDEGCEPDCMDKWDRLRLIIHLLTNRCFGLKEIKNEVRLIESTVLSPTFGLEEIKDEVRGLESAVAGISTLLSSPSFGLEEIKNEIILIESTVLSPTFGLEEIKNEIREILAALPVCSSDVLTTGPVIRDGGRAELIGKVLNNSVETRTVVVRAFNLDVCPKAQTDIETLVLRPNCARPFAFGAAPDEYEVQISGIVPGVMIYTTTRSCSGDLNPANTFRHSEFVCK